MELLIEPYYSKEEYIIDTNSSFTKDCDFQAFIHQYYSKAGLNLYSTDENYFKKDKVATVEGIFFKYDRICKNDIDIIELVDEIDIPSITDDIVNAVLTLENNEMLDDYDEEMPLICYLNRVYIYPEYRNKGIASYIFENLQELFTYITGDLTSIVVIFPKPQEPVGQTWHNIKDKGNVMLNKMVNMILKHGFETIGEDGFYVKGY